MYLRIKNLLEQIPIAIKIFALIFAMLTAMFYFGYTTVKSVHKQIYHNFYRQSAVAANALTDEIAPLIWLNQVKNTSSVLRNFANTPNLVFIRINDIANVRMDGLLDNKYESMIHQVVSENKRIYENDTLLILRNRISHHSEPLGYTIVGFSKQNMQATYQASLQKLITTGIALAIAIILLAIMIMRTITVPLKNAKKELANNLENAKDFSLRLPEKGGKELVEFSRMFNLLAEAVEENWLSLYQQLPSNQGYFENNPIPMLISDPFWNIRNANEAARKILHLNSTNMSERNLEEIFPAHDLVALMEEIRETDSDIINRELLCRNCDDAHRIQYVDIILLRNEYQAITDYLLILKTDELAINAAKMSTEELDKLRESLKNIELELEKSNKKISQEQYLRRRLERVMRLSENILQQRESTKIFDIITKEILHLLNSNGSEFLRWDNQQNILMSHSAESGNKNRKTVVKFPSGHPIYKTIEAGKSVKFNTIDVEKLPIWGIDATNEQMLLILPLKSATSFYGVLMVWRDAVKPYSENELQCVSLILECAVTVLDLIRLHEKLQAVNGDTNAIRKVQSDLQKAFQQQKMESLEILVSGIAHDFNNILGIITPNVDLLRMKYGNNPEILKRIEAIQSATKRATELTRQLVVFTQSDQIKMRSINLNRLIERVGAMLQRAFGEKIKLNMQLSPNLPAISGDESKLAQALVNLALNARDAMPDGGEFRIQTDISEYSPPDQPNVRKKYVHICVSDTGIGIPAKELFNIFDPFFTTKSPRKHTGMGLAVVYGIIKSHNGFITVESEVRKGTKFHIYIDAELPTIKITQTASPKRSEKTADNNNRVLIVDDEALVRESLNDLLEHLGYKVVQAENGMEALKILEKNSDIQLAIVDFAMPQMSGIQTIRAIRKINPSIRIILSSGFADQERAVTPNSGIQAFLQKPVQLERLAETLEMVLQNPV